MLWPELIKRASKNDEINLRKFFRSMDQVLKNQQNITAIPRKFHTYIKDIWILQLKLHSRIGKQPYKTLKHPRFRAAYDFLLIREKASKCKPDLGSWWTKFQKNDRLLTIVVWRERMLCQVQELLCAGGQILWPGHGLVIMQQQEV